VHPNEKLIANCRAGVLPVERTKPLLWAGAGPEGVEHSLLEIVQILFGLAPGDGVRTDGTGSRMPDQFSARTLGRKAKSP
jgi:hypothetical protein